MFNIAEMDLIYKTLDHYLFTNEDTDKMSKEMSVDLRRLKRKLESLTNFMHEHNVNEI